MGGKSVEKPIYNHVSGLLDPPGKIERDMKERGWTLEQVKDSIEGRKADFAAYVDPQKKDADVVIEALPTWEPSDEINVDASEKPLRVRLIQKNGSKLFDPAFLCDKGSKIEWVPDGSKMSAAAPGLKFCSYSEKYFDQDVTVMEMVGDIGKLDDVKVIESAMSDAGTKSDGEMTEQMLKNASFPGSMNGTGLFQTLVGLKIREVSERVGA